MRRLTPIIALGLLAVLGACETPTPPPPPPPVAYVPPPPPPEPPPLIVLPRQKTLANMVFEEAAVFRQTMAQASSIGADFGDGAQVADGLRRGAAFEPKQLQRGAVAFVAVTALSHPDFADGFRDYSIEDATRQDLAKRIIERPDYAASFPHADKAAGLAIAALDRLGADAWIKGLAIHQAAYDLQRQPWAKLAVTDREARLGQTKALSAERHAAPASAVETLRGVALAAAPVSVVAAPVPGPYTDVVNRGLAIAALAALGEAGEDRAEAIAALLDEPASLDCLNTSKLMLYQCLAGSDRGHYEDIFCLGRHAIADPGQCVVKAAGSPTPAFTPPPPPPPPVVAPKTKAKAPARRPAPKRR